MFQGFQGVLLDASGVFWGGNHFGMLGGSKEVMETLVKDGKIVRVLSNSSQLATKEKEKLKNHGLIEGVHYNFFLTSGEFARKLFLQDALPFQIQNKRFWTFGGVHPKFFSHNHLFEGSQYVETEYLNPNWLPISSIG